MPVKTRPLVDAVESSSSYVLDIQSWMRSLRAGNKSAQTLRTYHAAVTQLFRYLDAQGMPTQLHAVSREHVESFIGSLVATRSAGTANNRYRACKTFFAWAEDEGLLTRSPMSKMHPPIVPEQPVAIVADDVLAKLLKTCSGRSFDDRRDTAIIRLLVDTPMRRSELAGLLMTNLDLDARIAVVKGKGRRDRHESFGAKTAQALDRYLRERRAHRCAGLPAVFVGRQGALTGDGIYHILGDRCEQAGVPRIHPHQFRHTFAHDYLANGGSETNLMQLAGWKSRDMLRRYGASVAHERAIAEHRQLGRGDRV